MLPILGADRMSSWQTRPAGAVDGIGGVVPCCIIHGLGTRHRPRLCHAPSQAHKIRLISRRAALSDAALPLLLAPLGRGPKGGIQLVKKETSVGHQSMRGPFGKW